MIIHSKISFVFVVGLGLAPKIYKYKKAFPQIFLICVLFVNITAAMFSCMYVTCTIMAQLGPRNGRVRVWRLGLRSLIVIQKKAEP